LTKFYFWGIIFPGVLFAKGSISGGIFKGYMSGGIFPGAYFLTFVLKHQLISHMHVNRNIFRL